MTFSYSGDPSTSALDQVRFLVGDTIEADALLSNEEISWLLDEEPNVYFAAARAAEVMATTYKTEISVSADGMSYQGKDMISNLYDLADRLRKMGRRFSRLGIPYVGGISWAEREADDADGDLIPTHFRSHQMDHPQTGTTSRTINPLTPDQP